MSYFINTATHDLKYYIFIFIIPTSFFRKQSAKKDQQLLVAVVNGLRKVS